MSNQIRLAGRQGGRLVIQDRSIGSANQKASERPSDEPSDRSVGSANHISRSDYLRTDFLRTDHPSRRKCRISQSHQSVGLSSDRLSSDGSSFGRIVGSANHILRLDYLRTDFLRNQSETLKIITSHEWSRTARVTRSRSPNLVRHVIERDGHKWRKKSFYAQKPYVYVRIKSIYAQNPYVYVRIKPYIVCTSRFERIICLRV